MCPCKMHAGRKCIDVGTYFGAFGVRRGRTHVVLHILPLTIELNFTEFVSTRNGQSPDLDQIIQ
jgi:hypothetical protein